MKSYAQSSRKNRQQIPKEWQIVPFGSICNYSAGRTPPRNNSDYWSDSVIPWITISDMKQGQKVAMTKEKISKDAFEKFFSGRFVPSGSLLMSFKLTIGRTCFTAIDAVHNEAIISIQPKEDKEIDLLYLSYFLPSVDFNQYQDRAIKGFTLNKAKIDRIKIPLPSLSEQKRIAKTLSIIQEAIETQDKIIGNLRELKKVVMEKVFTKGLDGEKTKQTEIGEMPEGWELKTIDKIADIHNTLRQPINSVERSNIKGVYPYCGANGIVDHINDYRFDGEYVLIAEDGGYWGKGENSSYIMTGKFWVNNHAHVVKAKPQISNNHFLCYMLNFINIEPFITGDARGKLSKSVLTKIPLPCPTLLEQKRIAETIRAIDKKIEHHENKKATLQDFFKTALNNLMKGEKSDGRD